MDNRYNKPKEEPKASEQLVEDTIISTEIYRRAKLAIVTEYVSSPKVREIIFNAQRKQVAYGIDKYPEPLNPNTWSIPETMEHIFDESIDRLHYLIMLLIKVEQALVNGLYASEDEIKTVMKEMATINGMIRNAIKELDCVITLRILPEKERHDDSLDASTHVVNAGADFDGDKLNHFSPDEIDEMVDKSKGPVEHMRQIIDNKKSNSSPSALSWDGFQQIFEGGGKSNPPLTEYALTLERGKSNGTKIDVEK